MTKETISQFNERNRDSIDSMLIKNKSFEDFEREYIDNIQNNNQTCEYDFYKNPDLTKYIQEEINRSINLSIIAKLYWLDRDNVIRLHKFKKILGNGTI